ncbi:protein kinase family protein [Streptomyces oceani]|uniref:Serine/threonine protein kinase n=1 Tax=Streptomyces oceani TaxID=1075402 RepID=A0A1E7JWV9_9ACTN|nr:protein kinase family protein [Streptomyces oceani]OEU96087.1 hypothetical protein AN216_22295 [Streptomyces oceani]
MAERNTAAVDVASTSGEHEAQSAQADEATADGATEQYDGDGSDTAATTETPTSETEHETDTSSTTATRDLATNPRPHSPETVLPEPPDLHSGHKLAQRYRLEECITRRDGFSSWRAVDEMLRRAVGVHALAAHHPRARSVLAAARSAALLGDPRFVQVLDAVEEEGLVYVVHEWLPDATPLSELLAAAPLPAHEAYQLVRQLAEALTAAHREGLAHLRINPSSVLRTGAGQYRIRSLAVSAALRGTSSDRPQRADTAAIGALLYAALTQRWPYADGAHGLSGVGNLSGGQLIAPEQVRAGVHRGLSRLAMRALREESAGGQDDQSCSTPEELRTAVAELPRIRPPEHSLASPVAPQPSRAQAGGRGIGPTPHGGSDAAAASEPTPPTLPGRTGKTLKWGVSALLIIALGLGSWQVADTLLKGDSPGNSPGNQTEDESDQEPISSSPIKIVDAQDIDPQGDGSENPKTVRDAIDDDPKTSWYTRNYYGQSDFGNLKSGVGLVLDLDKPQPINKVQVRFQGQTSAEVRAAPKNTTSAPSNPGAFRKLTESTGDKLNYRTKKPVTTRFVLVWLTELPLAEDGNYRGRITEVNVFG